MEVLIRVATGYGIVNCNPRCTYCPLVPKRDTFYVTDGSSMFEDLIIPSFSIKTENRKNDTAWSHCYNFLWLAVVINMLFSF